TGRDFVTRAIFSVSTHEMIIAHVFRTLRSRPRREAPNAPDVARDVCARRAIPRRALADLSRRRHRAGRREARSHGGEPARLRLLSVLAQPRRRRRLELAA